MVITVFGATGGLGRQVVQRAVGAGHAVRAHARSPDVLPDVEGLATIEGDLADRASIAAAVAGGDAVLWCAGHAKGTDPAVYGEAMREVLQAMHVEGVRRLVAVSGAGLELPGDRSGLSRRVIITLLKLFAGKVLAGKEHEWAAIGEAPPSIEWTVVRVARMTTREASGRVAVDLEAVSGSPVVAYADIAQWMLDQLEDPTYVGEAPFVSGG